MYDKTGDELADQKYIGANGLISFDKVYREEHKKIDEMNDEISDEEDDDKKAEKIWKLNKEFQDNELKQIREIQETPA